MVLRNLVMLLVTVFDFLPVTVVGECSCDPGDDKDDDKALRYKVRALSSILVAGAIGVVLPMLGKVVPALRPERDVFLVIKAFAAGVILATGFIHVLPEAFKNLTSSSLPCKPWRCFSFTGFTAMLATIGVLMIEVYATSYYHQRTHFRGEAEKVVVEEADSEKTKSGGTDEQAGHVDVQRHAGHGHSHGSVTVSSEKDSGALETLRHRVVSQVLELGIVVHSVIIGVSLGASENPRTIKPLIVALSFHQFFEGMGLGGCIAQAKLKGLEATVMALFFCLTTPIGIAVGIAISNGYDENSHTALIVEGVLNAASAGILIYMALVDLIAADFMSPRMQSNGRLLLASNLALLIGAGCMSLLAKWA